MNYFCADDGTPFGTGTTCPQCGGVDTMECYNCGANVEPADTTCANCNNAIMNGGPPNLNAAMQNLNNINNGGVLAGGLGGLMVGGGGFGGPVTPQAQQKIEDALTHMPSLADRNAEFLKSIGADPAKAALNRNQARQKVIELMNVRQIQYEEIHFLGNSLGIDEVRIQAQISCATCGAGYLEDEDYDGNSAPTPGQKWCSSDDAWVNVTATSTLLGRKEDDWVEWRRTWEALRKDYGDKFKVGQPEEYVEKIGYLGHVETIEGDPLPNLLDVIQGMNVRIEDPQGNSYYAQVWEKNPLDPTSLPVLLDLRSMTNLDITPAWTIVEVV